MNVNGNDISNSCFPLRHQLPAVLPTPASCCWRGGNAHPTISHHILREENLNSSPFWRSIQFGLLAQDWTSSCILVVAAPFGEKLIGNFSLVCIIGDKVHINNCCSDNCRKKMMEDSAKWCAIAPSSVVLMPFFQRVYRRCGVYEYLGPLEIRFLRSLKSGVFHSEYQK